MTLSSEFRLRSVLILLNNLVFVNTSKKFQKHSASGRQTFVSISTSLSIFQCLLFTTAYKTQHLRYLVSLVELLVQSCGLTGIRFVQDYCHLTARLIRPKCSGVQD
uniref:Putative secreted protein n=1 Tax=Amblyomma tuberculatum TaxID=48802 RepID=A0A6M2E493_9ACAR